MAKRHYPAFVSWLREEFGDHLRWVASFDHASFDYAVEYIRDDLKTELTEQQLDTIVHRTLVVYNRDRLADVYVHLGDPESLVVQHEVATAVHVYLTEETGVVVKLADGAEFSMPAFPEECRRRLTGD
jgi:hypothetical protein